MKLIPTAGKIVVKRNEADDKSKGGIIIPDQAKEKPQNGKIVAMGKGKLLDNGSYAQVELQEGLTVVFDTYAGHEIEIEGEKFVIMEMDRVLAVLS